MSNIKNSPPNEPPISIGKNKAIELYNTKWWKDKTPKQIIRAQLFTAEMCMDSRVFFDCIEEEFGCTPSQLAMFYTIVVKSFLKSNDIPTKEEVLLFDKMGKKANIIDYYNIVN